MRITPYITVIPMANKGTDATSKYSINYDIWGNTAMIHNSHSLTLTVHIQCWKKGVESDNARQHQARLPAMRLMTGQAGKVQYLLRTIITQFWNPKLFGGSGYTGSWCETHPYPATAQQHWQQKCLTHPSIKFGYVHRAPDRMVLCLSLEHSRISRKNGPVRGTTPVQEHPQLPHTGVYGTNAFSGA